MKAAIRLDKLSKLGLQIVCVWRPRNDAPLPWDVLLTDGKYYRFPPRVQPGLLRGPFERALIDSPVSHSRYQRVQAWQELLFMFRSEQCTPQFLEFLASAPSPEEKEKTKYERIDRQATATARWHFAPYYPRLLDTYIIAVSGHQTGDTVTVTRRDGETSTHILGERLAGYNNLYKSAS
jgi:hypothetical protein